VYEVEPYCYPQNILGDEHPQFGLARNSWLSGTASWMYQAATQYILGVKPGHNGLEVTPCAPKDWKTYQVVRHYRGATYNIKIERESKSENSVIEMTVNGTPIEENIIPIAKAGGVCNVIVKVVAVKIMATVH
jgi:cellobiose phosphorylase